MQPSRSALEALADKYRELLRLRTSLVDADPETVRRAMRHLSRRFPGCLRELHSLPLVVIEERRAVVERMLAGEAGEPWVAWMSAYHERLRALLSVEVRSATRPGVAEAEPATSFARTRSCRRAVRGARPSIVASQWVEGRFGLRSGSLLPLLFPRAPR